VRERFREFEAVRDIKGSDPSREGKGEYETVINILKGGGKNVYSLF